MTAENPQAETMRPVVGEVPINLPLAEAPISDRDREDQQRDEEDQGGGSYVWKAVIGIGALAAAATAIGIRQKLVADRGDPNRTLFGDGPLSAARGGPSGDWDESRLVSRAITVNRPRQELYDFWRNFKNLQLFLENVRSVTEIDGTRSRWIIEAPAGRTVEFISRITEDQPGQLIAWTSEDGADVANSGRIEFEDAPAGRGTIVRATIAYDPPGGALGRAVATLLQREPKTQARRDLRRFKQLMETGEITTSQPRPAATAASSD